MKGLRGGADAFWAVAVYANRAENARDVRSKERLAGM
jgi:hypothetical protein